METRNKRHFDECNEEKSFVSIEIIDFSLCFEMTRLAGIAGQAKFSFSFRD
jgi:hypothetical protein